MNIVIFLIGFVAGAVLALILQMVVAKRAGNAEAEMDGPAGSPDVPCQRTYRRFQSRDQSPERLQGMEEETAARTGKGPSSGEAVLHVWKKHCLGALLAWNLPFRPAVPP